MLHMEIIQERLERNSIWPWLLRSNVSYFAYTKKKLKLH
jgi:translation elongation factor EF-4